MTRVIDALRVMWMRKFLFRDFFNVSVLCGLRMSVVKIYVPALVIDQLLFGFIKFFSDFLLQWFSFFPFIFTSSKISENILSHPLLPLFNIQWTLGICSTAASVTATLNFTHCWSTTSVLYRISVELNLADTGT